MTARFVIRTSLPAVHLQSSSHFKTSFSAPTISFSSSNNPIHWSVLIRDVGTNKEPVRVGQGKKNIRMMSNWKGWLGRIWLPFIPIFFRPKKYIHVYKACKFIPINSGVINFLPFPSSLHITMAASGIYYYNSL